MTTATRSPGSTSTQVFVPSRVIGDGLFARTNHDRDVARVAAADVSLT
jgi:hypothetical protein